MNRIRESYPVRLCSSLVMSVPLHVHNGIVFFHGNLNYAYESHALAHSIFRSVPCRINLSLLLLPFPFHGSGKVVRSFPIEGDRLDRILR
jgi:hypothetical protein